MHAHTACAQPGAKMDSNRIKTLVELMGQGASDAVCIAAADAAPLTYAKLRQLSSYVMSVLNESGIGREGSYYGIQDYLEIKYVCLGI